MAAERADKAQSWTYAEEAAGESLAASNARRAAQEIGLDAVTAGTGAALRLLAASLNARHVVEIGTGTGVSGVWLLEGMAPDGVLTTIDVEVEYQRHARAAFAETGVASSRTRTIAGRSLEVLPRLADGAYDVVLLDADPTDLSDHLAQARRLLRTGGAVAVTQALWFDRVADPARRDVDTVAMRELVRDVMQSEDWLGTLLPVGGGLLIGIKR